MEKNVHRSPAAYFKAMVSNPLTLLWFGGLLAMIIASLIPQAGLSEIDSGFGRDKAARVVTFMLLSFYPVAFFPSIRMGLMVSTFVAPLGFLLEVFQKYVPGRNFSPGDMIANNIGAIIGIILALTIRFFFRTGQFKYGGKKHNALHVFNERSEEKIIETEERETEAEMQAQYSVSGTPHADPGIFKKWRSKVMILMLLFVLGYLGWIIAGDHFSPKRHLKEAQPKGLASLEQAAVVVETSRDTQDSKFSESDTVKPAPEDIALIETELPSVLNSAPEMHLPTVTPEPELKPAFDIMVYDPPFSAQIMGQATPAKPLSEIIPDVIQENGASPLPEPVETEVILENKTEPVMDVAVTKTVFSLRAGAFLEKKNAENLIEILKSKGYHPYIFEAVDNKNRFWYAVQLSDHVDLEKAATAAAFFKNKENRPVYITHKGSLKTLSGPVTR